MQDHDNAMPPGSVAVVLGTRPEIIKLAHVIRGLGPACRVVHTGQHFDFGLSESFLEVFGIAEPSTFLGVGGMTRVGQIGAAVSALGDLFAEEAPRVVVVQGDTNTTLAGALAANAYEIPLVHVEAGLRSYDRRMPEEHNRVLTDHLADLLCVPTETARANLAREGISHDGVVVTGNTVVEAVLGLMPGPEARHDLLASRGLTAGRYVLSTFHRPENVDDPDRFGLILEQLGELGHRVVLPLHPRSRGMARTFGLESLLEAVEVIEPLGYPEFLGLSAESAYLVSDSGGVQEEASIYKRPVVVVRRSTERPEVLGTFVRLAHVDEITELASGWLADIEAVHDSLADIPTPYGDGHASERILEGIVSMVSGDA
ncbi:MAG: UDP-N-acetylglucosamine 2-epimerase (non-hydrolyzing) [Actinobacteria bacterium]|nr:UDP-N-acetylglucosamine 2-epimerase (non-hydrolyzing) [Actinomycetota bacterium]